MMTGRLLPSSPRGTPNTVTDDGYVGNGQPGTTWTLRRGDGDTIVSNIASEPGTAAHDNELVTSLYASTVKFETCDPSPTTVTAGTPPDVTDDGDDGLHKIDSCDEATDSIVNAANSATCDNGLFCDGAETCDPALDCQAGTPPATDDGVACTDDSCDEATDAIVNTANDTSCDNGLFCDGHFEVNNPLHYRIPFLVWGAGVPAGADLYALNPTSRQAPSTPGRPDYNAALQPVRDGDAGNLALSLLGLGPVPGSMINAAQNLFVGTPPAAGCRAGPVLVLDDGVGCTVDSCDEGNDLIVNELNHAACDNGLFCDGAETCDALLDCQAGFAPTIDDGIGCTDDSCDEATDTIVNTANHGSCDNGLFCDGAETCDPGPGLSGRNTAGDRRRRGAAPTTPVTKPRRHHRQRSERVGPARTDSSATGRRPATRSWIARPERRRTTDDGVGLHGRLLRRSDGHGPQHAE